MSDEPETIDVDSVAVSDDRISLRDLVGAPPALVAIAQALLDFEAIHAAADLLPVLDPMDPFTEAVGGMMIDSWKDVDAALQKVRP